MTLEEAKKELKKLYEEKHEAFLRTSMSLFDAEANGIKEAIKIVDKIDDEPVGNSDTLTLEELANKLREIIDFRYLTACGKMVGNNIVGLDLFRGDRPWFSDDGYWVNNYVVAGGSLVIPAGILAVNLDLSEYVDESGKVDYSKCIVEVQE